MKVESETESELAPEPPISSLHGLSAADLPPECDVASAVPCDKAVAGKSVHVVWRGYKRGLFYNWQNAYKSVKDFPGAANAKYASLDDARVAWFLGSTRARMGQTSSASPSRYAPTPGPAAQPDRFRTQASTAAVMESKLPPWPPWPAPDATAAPAPLRVSHANTPPRAGPSTLSPQSHNVSSGEENRSTQHSPRRPGSRNSGAASVRSSTPFRTTSPIGKTAKEPCRRTAGSPYTPRLSPLSTYRNRQRLSSTSGTATPVPRAARIVIEVPTDGSGGSDGSVTEAGEDGEPTDSEDGETMESEDAEPIQGNGRYQSLEYMTPPPAVGIAAASVRTPGPSEISARSSLAPHANKRQVRFHRRADPRARSPPVANLEVKAKCVWVVLRGTSPGVYRKLHVALRALGEHPDLKLTTAADMARGDRLFCRMFMMDRVVKLPE